MRGTILSVTPTTVVYLPMSCTLCGKGHETFILDRARFERWQAGEFIQVAFPGLSAADREVIMTGTHDECFNRLFPDDEEDG